MYQTQMPKRLFVFFTILIVLAIGFVIYSFKQANPQDIMNKKLEPILSVSAFDVEKNANTASVEAGLGDTIVFTFSAENREDVVIPGYVFKVQLGELSRYVDFKDLGGASYDQQKQELSWTPIDISPYSVKDKKITTVIKKALPADEFKYALEIEYNNKLRVPIARPQVAGVNSASENDNPQVAIVSGQNNQTAQAVTTNDYRPATSGPENQVFPISFAMLTVVTYMMYRKVAQKSK
jgi:hypothetical protein